MNFTDGMWSHSGIKCPNCGGNDTEINLMEVLVSMPPQNKYRCKCCGHWWTSTEYKIQTDFPDARPFKQSPTIRGWICPVCGAGVSPYQDHCPCCSGKSLTPTWTHGTGDLGYAGKFGGEIKGVEENNGNKSNL